MFIVGELINSTRNQVSNAIAEGDEQTIRKLARDQAEQGANAIDVNAGQSLENEARNLVWLIEIVKDELGNNAQIVVDTADPEVMKVGLEACSGNATMINSISNEENKKPILDLASKIDCPIIGLAMGHKGMPKSAEDRVEEARVLVDKCEKAGINPERLWVDMICMSVGSNPNQATEVLKAIQTVNEEFDVKTFIAVSNISFGLPNRGLLNQSYLTMLLNAGLDGAMLDPTDKQLIGTVYATEALTGRDNYCMRYIKNQKGRK